MVELIATIILIYSLFGIGVIVLKKVPILLTLPENLPQKESFISKVKERLKRANSFRNFSYEIFLQKILTKIRILSLKVDHHTFNWIQKLREQSKERNLKRIDDYWEKIKKEIKNKFPPSLPR